jgi:glutathione synthase/RimK-type ligase-like ATP-grasp enzyme
VSKKKENISVLVLGDRTDFDAYAKFNRERKLLRKSGFDYHAVNYRRFLRGKIPPMKNEKVIIFLFFPFSYWNKHIERKGYKGLYGNISFSRKFMRFWQRVNSIIVKKLPDKKVMFINGPSTIGVYRDKLTVKKKLSKTGISQAKLYETTDPRKILDLLGAGHSLFIKPRCGSMGKGITFLGPFDWQTNFLFRKNRIISRIADHGWKFREVTGNEDFLRKLMKGDILIEEAVNPLMYKESIVDLRVYVFLNKVMYVYPRRNNPEKIVTNISQGAHGDPSILPFLPGRLVEKAKRMAVKTSKVLGLSFCGIDIMIACDRKSVFVMDVNLFPGFPRRKRFNLTKSIIEELSKSRDKGRLFF